MLQRALDWGSTYVSDTLMRYKGCCCASAADGKSGDLVVLSDWDKDENALGYAGSLNRPFAVQHFPSVAGPSASRGGSYAEDVVAPKGGCLLQPDRVLSDSENASQETMALRELMKRFVQEMVHGKAFWVVIEDGKTEPCRLSLTPNLLYFQLEAAGVTHDIPLRNVKDVCPGELSASSATPVQLDDLCNTRVLRNNECVTFKLASIRERDELTKCVKVLALALDS
jgi:hypothetical protein